MTEPTNYIMTAKVMCMSYLKRYKTNYFASRIELKKLTKYVSTTLTAYVFGPSINKILSLMPFPKNTNLHLFHFLMCVFYHQM